MSLAIVYTRGRQGIAAPLVTVEVHISNPGAREEFRHVSVLSTVVDGTIAGFGAVGYALAVDALVQLGLQ